MLAGIYWREPKNDLPEAQTAPDQAEITHTLDPHMDHYSIVISTLIMHEFIHQLSF